MNNEPTASKMDRHLEDALDKGANVVLGGSRAGDRPTNLYYEPTVVTDVGVDTLINREETFGPIVPLIRVRSTRRRSTSRTTRTSVSRPRCTRRA